MAIPLQTGPVAVSRQVARAMGARKDPPDDQKKEKRERGKEPPPCHPDNLQSSPKCFVSHPGVYSSLIQSERQNTERDRCEQNTYTHTYKR